MEVAWFFDITEFNTSLVVGFLVWFAFGIILILAHHYRSNKT